MVPEVLRGDFSRLLNGGTFCLLRGRALIRIPVFATRCGLAGTLLVHRYSFLIARLVQHAPTVNKTGRRLHGRRPVLFYLETAE